MHHEPHAWYAVYTKSRCEKKVAALLARKQLECYCPMNEVESQWSDRRKIVQEPLFKSYVFVRIPERLMSVVRQTEGVVNFVYWLGRPAVISDPEIDMMRRFWMSSGQWSWSSSPSAKMILPTCPPCVSVAW
ncbi:UpxY family transcription antiterminator [Chitinophaga sedimenti]|uniref:UpxY family transcription antiterminator n=1 Tax=Chitinophaga sedimenti TaxID=2033606 RepID=UPI002006CF54|nr:UpxY family transcription antiterminator [Chitinophaga sedimenti]MCK7558014.1 UpxY family transcription antiterminator [Chitinophaga sedimenti]